MATTQEIQNTINSLNTLYGQASSDIQRKAIEQAIQKANSEYERTALEDKAKNTTSSIQGLINAQQAPGNAPTLDPYNEKRLKALEEEAAPKSLIEDPLFQGQRAQLVQGGQQALSSVQNKQKAMGVTGGFQNVGSVADIYDRLSGQLAGLGESATKTREAKRDTVAQERQGLLDRQRQYADSQIAFENQRKEALAAAERGDYEMAMQMYQLAEQSRQQMQALEQASRAADKQMLGSVIGGLGTAAGSIMGSTWSNTKKKAE
jgi:hypothetical protein